MRERERGKEGRGGGRKGGKKGEEWRLRVQEGVAGVRRQKDGGRLREREDTTAAVTVFSLLKCSAR